jgi:hypothetical protein
LLDKDTNFAAKISSDQRSFGKVRRSRGHGRTVRPAITIPDAPVYENSVPVTEAPRLYPLMRRPLPPTLVNVQPCITAASVPDSTTAAEARNDQSPPLGTVYCSPKSVRVCAKVKLGPRVMALTGSDAVPATLMMVDRRETIKF